jgi:hypothetical protein
VDPYNGLLNTCFHVRSRFKTDSTAVLYVGYSFMYSALMVHKTRSARERMARCNVVEDQARVSKDLPKLPY